MAKEDPMMNKAILRLACIALLPLIGVVATQEDVKIPIVVFLCDGSIGTVSEETLYSIERDARRAFSPKENRPKVVIAMVTDTVGNIRLDLQGKLSKYDERIFIEIFSDKGHLSWHQECGKKSGSRTLSKEECHTLIAEIDGLKAGELQYLSPIRATVEGEEQIIGGGASVFLRMDDKKGERIYMNNPPLYGDNKYADSSTIWIYTRLIEIVQRTRNVVDANDR